MKFYDDPIQQCFLCHRWCECARHHCLPGKNRAKADRYGLYVSLCPDCHRTVHLKNHEAMLYLQQYAQRKAMQENGWTTEQFIAEFGKNYL